MEIDAVTFRVFIRELEEKLVDSRLQKIFQPGDYEFIFRFRLPGENYFLIFSLEANRQRIHPIPEKFGQSREPSAFCMMLRKHLAGGKILYLSQRGNDRILQMSVLSYFEESGPEERILILELTGKSSNIILCDHREKIISAYNRKDPRRDLSTGQPYEAPPPPQGINPFLIEQKDFLSLFQGEKVLERPVKDVLFHIFTGMTRDIVREILFHSGIGITTPLKNTSSRQKESLWHSFRDYFDRVESEEFSPVIYYDPEDRDMEEEPKRWALWDYAIFSDRPKEFLPTIGDTLQAVFYPQTASRRFEEIKKELSGALQKKIKKVARRIEKQETDLQGAEKTVHLKKNGELILAFLDQIPPKAEEVDLDDYYRDPPAKIKVKLDPSKSASDNAQLYFDKYKKARRGVPKIQERLEISRSELSDLEDTLYEVESSESPAELAELQESLQVEGIYTPPATPGKRKAAEPLGPRKFDLSSGYVVLVGRNSRQNDEITLKTAQKEDLWFHARQIPGSHVVLRIQKPSKQVPDEVIHRAAQLAAYYSKARASSKVPVDYTRIKDVRKTKGQKAGKVFYVNEKTIYVKPEAV